MHKETISFRLESDKREVLDAVASSLDRDRSYVINEAIEAYLDIHRCGMPSQNCRRFLDPLDARRSQQRFSIAPTRKSSLHLGLSKDARAGSPVPGSS